MMLAGLILASRFRFAYLERPDDVAAKFADTVSIDKFSANCWQMHYDLDRLTQAVELGLLDPDAFVKAFGEENRGLAERLLTESARTRDELLAILPEPNVTVTDAMRPDVRAAIGRFLQSTEPINSQFLVTGLDVFRTELLRQLERGGKVGW